MRPISKNSNLKLIDRFRSPVGDTSLIFGGISAVVFPVTIHMSYKAEGLATMKVGALGLFAFFMALVGLIMAIMDINDDDTPMSLPRFTRTLNLICLILWGAILAFGIYTVVA